jgi:hypothetical protein
MAALAEQLLAADQHYARGEAAVTIAAAHLERPGAAREILEALDLTGASWHWSATRVALIMLIRCRSGRDFSADTLRSYVPQRAWPLIRPALDKMTAGDLISAVNETGRSPVAHRRLPVYALTLAGERLSRDISPAFGMTPALTKIT